MKIKLTLEQCEILINHFHHGLGYLDQKIYIQAFKGLRKVREVLAPSKDQYEMERREFEKKLVKKHPKFVAGRVPPEFQPEQRDMKLRRAETLKEKVSIDIDTNEANGVANVLTVVLKDLYSQKLEHITSEILLELNILSELFAAEPKKTTKKKE